MITNPNPKSQVFTCAIRSKNKQHDQIIKDLLKTRRFNCRFSDRHWGFIVINPKTKDVTADSHEDFAKYVFDSVDEFLLWLETPTISIGDYKVIEQSNGINVGCQFVSDEQIKQIAKLREIIP